MAIPESYPEEVRRVLARLFDDLAPLAPEPSALVVYGSLAKGNYRHGESDVNLAVVLRSASEQVLSALGPPLHVAWRAVRVEPFLVSRAELPRLVDVFPIKLADIQAHHHTIAGEDPFTGLVIERGHMRLRVEQELRNHLLRLRRHYLFAASEPRELSRAVYRSASSVGIELGALLHVAGKPEATGRLEQVVVAAAAAFDLDRGVLDRLCAFKQGASEADMRGLYLGLMGVIERAVAVADTLEVKE